MRVRTFQFGWRLQAHDRKFPVGSSVALGRGEGAVWQGWGGQASGVRERQNGRLLRAETQGKQMKKQNKKNEVTDFPVVSGGWGSHHHRYACATQRARSSGGASEAHLAASSNKAWQGLAGVGRQRREEGDKRRHSFKACSVALPAVGHRCLTCREGLKDGLWRLGLL